MKRPLLVPFESLVYGPSYAWLQYLIRSPEPLNPADIWDRVTFDLPPVADWVRNHWPVGPLRPRADGCEDETGSRPGDCRALRRIE